MEGFENPLRSTLAQFHFAYKRHKLKGCYKRHKLKGCYKRHKLKGCYKRHKLKGCHSVYVPEQHLETMSAFYERDDEAHLIKVANQLMMTAQ